MADIRKKVAAKYQEANRYKNFGPCLRVIEINGFRGIEGVDLALEFPVTAISGLNGAGKSTIGQLATCAYRKPTTALHYKRQYVKDFFPVSVADPNPFRADANVVFHYETDDHKKTQEVTVSRKKSEWSGYKRQPERHCYYIGFTVYIPKVERRDLSVYGGKDLAFTEPAFFKIVVTIFRDQAACLFSGSVLSGFSMTASTRDQLRVAPDHRCGLLALAAS